MQPQLRPYQTRIIDDIADAFHRGAQTVLASLPTGAGKTVCIAEVCRRIGDRPQICIAHRRELVAQISVALARGEVPHRVIAPDATRAYIVQKQIAAVGASWLWQRAAVVVASVDTLLRRDMAEFRRFEYWHTDEGHHLLPTNKWGRAAALCPRARGTAWTATPMRADRRPLARSAGGCYDILVQGPSPAELVSQDFLVPVEAYSLPAAFDRSQIAVSATTGDFALPALRAATRTSQIVGDVVSHYLRVAPGLRGLTFCVDIDHAERQAAAFRAAGVRAEAVSNQTPDTDRENIFEALGQDRLQEVCNVDIFGEGTDCPEIGVVSLARATESLPLCFQQIGRVRRPAPRKRVGIVLDHVGNLLTHGLPDGVESWTLDGEPRRAGGGARGMPVRQCRRPGCWRAYESWSLRCPYCGWEPEPVTARKPEEIEGDLVLYGPELRDELLRRAAAAVAPAPGGRATSGRDVMIRRHMDERLQAQLSLREAMQWWGGIQGAAYGLDIRSAQRKFMATFGVCVLTAQGLGGPEARKLTGDIWRDVGL